MISGKRVRVNQHNDWTQDIKDTLNMKTQEAVELAMFQEPFQHVSLFIS